MAVLFCRKSKQGCVKGCEGCVLALCPAPTNYMFNRNQKKHASSGSVTPPSLTRSSQIAAPPLTVGGWWLPPAHGARIKIAPTPADARFAQYVPSGGRGRWSSGMGCSSGGSTDEAVTQKSCSFLRNALEFRYHDFMFIPCLLPGATLERAASSATLPIPPM